MISPADNRMGNTNLTDGHVHSLASESISNFELRIIANFWISISPFQYRVYVRTEKVTPEIEKLVDQETLTKARLYNIDKSRFSFLHSIYSQILLSLLLVYQAYPYAWNLTGQILQHYGYHGNYELAQTLLLMSLSTLFFALLEQPWTLYSNFVIEERHGFNKYTLSFYCKDLVKKFVVEQAIMLPVTAIAYHIIRIGGDFFFIYLWGFCTLLFLFLLTIYPDFIAPFFDTFIPLPESDLKTNIEKLAASINYPLARLFVVHGSKRSSHSNAYLFGMFNKKTVVLYDTLIDKSVIDLSGLFEKKDEQQTKEDKVEEKEVEGGTADEILAVLGHEFGHWQLSHMPKRLLLNQAILFITIAIFSLLYQNEKVYAAFGFFDEKPILIGLSLIFEYIFEPITEVSRFRLPVSI